MCTRRSRSGPLTRGGTPARVQRAWYGMTARVRVRETARQSAGLSGRGLDGQTFMGIGLVIIVTVTFMDSERQDNAWREVLQAAQTLENEGPGAVLIGGLAVYLHTQNHSLAAVPVSRARLAEFSHDVDACLSLQDLGALRDLFEVTANARLNKHQITLGRIEADLYVEHNNKLRVPYDELLAHAVTYGSMRVAAIGHLLVLKLDAEAGRAGSSKGDKDTRDLVKLTVLASDEDRNLLVPYLDSRGLARLKEVGATPSTFTLIARGNAQEAKQLRTIFNSFVDRLQERGPGSDEKPGTRRARRQKSQTPR